ncbi:LysE family translocator [Pendulispora albinea]|uniref:LysE family translocator n=1 Tax=Pendulispora albinea TaxID=2741071 RepID=A0ABZ2MA12_9BACT
MNMQTAAIFLVASAALIAVPGPNHLYIMTRSIAEGRRSGFASAFGVETGTLVHIAIAAAGLSYVIAQSVIAFSVVKYSGAAYLVYLGIRTLRARDEAQTVAATAPQSLRRVYLEGVVVNVFNPKVILFFLAFLPQFIDPRAGSVPLQIVVLGLVLLTLGLVSDIVYVIGAGSLGQWMRTRASFRRYQRYISGVVYLGLGATTAMVGGGQRR